MLEKNPELENAAPLANPQLPFSSAPSYNEDDDSPTLWNVVKATQQYRNLTRKSTVTPEDTTNLKWAMRVLGRHADEYQPITSNLKDIIQGLQVLPQDTYEAIIGPFRGKFMEDTIPFAGAAASGYLGYIGGEGLVAGLAKGLSLVPGPIGAAAKTFQAGKYLYAGAKIAGAGILSTYTALTTNELLKEPYERKHLENLGIETPEKTIFDIMQTNLENLPRSSVAAMTMMHSFGYLSGLRGRSLAREKMNSMPNEENSNNLTVRTMAKTEEAQNAFSKVFEPIIEEELTEQSITTKAGKVEEIPATEDILPEIKPVETMAEQTDTLNFTYEPTPEEIQSYIEAGPKLEPKKAQRTGLGTNVMDEQAQINSAKAFYNLPSPIREGAKRFNMLDTYGYFKVMREEATGILKFDEKLPINSEQRLSLFYENNQKLMLDKLPDAQKHQYMFSLFHGVNNFAAANRTRFVNNGLFADLRRNGVNNVAKEFQALRGDKQKIIDMMNYYLDKPNNADNMGKVFADNMRRTYTEIKNKLGDSGVIIQDLDYAYAPQRAASNRLIQHGRENFISDLKQWIDTKRMGLGELRSAEIDNYISHIYDTFKRLDSYSDLSFTAEGESFVSRERRVIHFKDGQGYHKYMEKYGAVDNVIDAVISNIQSTANLIGMIEQFGPDPKTVASNLLTSIPSPLEGTQNKLLLRQSAEALKLSFLKKANNNLYNALFYKGEGGFLLNHDWLGTALRYYNGLEGIGKNLITANNAIWEIIESPLATSFLNASYEGGNTPQKIVNFYKESINGLSKAFENGLSPKQEKALQEIGVRYNIQNEIVPYKLSQGTPYDMPLGARKANHLINKVKGTDMLSNVNKTTATVTWQNMVGNYVKSSRAWEQLPKRIRGMLEGGGIIKADWDLLLKSDVLVHDDLFIDLPLNLRSNLLSPIYIGQKHAKNPKLSIISEKLAAVQHNHVQRSVTSAQFESTAAFLGNYAVSRDLGAWVARNSIAFKGYQFDRIARWISMMDLEGHSLTMDKFAAYAWQRMAIGLTVGMMRWGLVGRAPQLDSVEDFMGLLIDSAARGDLMPLAITKEFFADFYFTQGNTWSETLSSKLSGSVLGPGALSLAKNAANFTNGISNMISGDYDRAFGKMRKAFPGSGFIPLDIMFNRILLDNVFSSIDEDGFYALAKKEMATNAKNNFKYFLEPGHFTKVRGGDLLGATGAETLAQEAQKEMTEERAEFKKKYTQAEIRKGIKKEIAARRAEKAAYKYELTHELYKDRKKAMSQIAALNRRKVNTSNPVAWDKIQKEIDKVQARYDLKVAAHFKNNRPKTVTKRQADAAYRRALMQSR
jgi:hypothetical protein